MALHPQFPESPFVTLDPSIRWFATDETLRGLHHFLPIILGHQSSGRDKEGYCDGEVRVKSEE